MALPGDQGQPGERIRIHRQGQSHGRHLQRYRRSRTGRHRSTGRQARHGRKGTAVQDIRRTGLLRHRAGREGSGKIHRRSQGHLPHLRGHKPRGHQGPRVLRDRAQAQGGVRHPRHARRPARHGHHLGSRPAQRPGTAEQEDRGHPAGGQRSRCRSHCLHQPLHRAGCAPREHRNVRQQRSSHGLTHKSERHEADICH